MKWNMAFADMVFYMLTGASWGYDEISERSCVGCGPQEEFYGCSDIRIVDDATHQSMKNPTDSPTTSEKQTTLGHVTKEATTPGQVAQSTADDGIIYIFLSLLVCGRILLPWTYGARSTVMRVSVPALAAGVLL